MEKIKLYLIVDAEGTVYAISEEHKLIKKYYKQRKFNGSRYLIIKIKRKSLVNKLLMDMEDLYLVDSLTHDLVMTVAEDSIMDDIINSQIYYIQDVYKRLESLLCRLDLEEDEERVFLKTIKILKKIETDEDELDQRLNIQRTLGDSQDINSLMRMIHEANLTKGLYKEIVQEEGRRP